MNPSPLVPTRAAELDDLVRLSMPGDSSRLLLVHGRPGDGMTTLLAAYAARLRQHVLAPPVETINGLPWERDEPGALLARLALEDDSEHRSPIERARLLGCRWATGVGDDRWDRVLVIDHAEDLDRESAQVLATLTAARTAARCLVVAGCADVPSSVGRGREGATTRPSAPAVFRANAAGELRLATLDVADSVHLATAAGLDVPVAGLTRAVAMAGGNPGMLVEIFALAAATPGNGDDEWPLPDAVRARVGDGWAALGDAARNLLFCASVLSMGGRAPVLVEDVLSLAGQEWDDAILDDVESTGLARFDGIPLAMQVPPVVARAVVERRGHTATAAAHDRASRLTLDEWTRLAHRWLARPVRDEGLAAQLEDLGHRLRRGGDLARAAEVMHLAGLASPGNREAEARRAWAVDCFVGVGDLRRLAGLRSLLEKQRTTALGEEALGYLAVVQGDRASAQIRLDRAWGLVNPETDPRLASVIAQRQVVHSLCQCRAEELAQWADRAVDLAARDPLEDAVEAQAIQTLASCVTAGRDVALEQSRELLERHPLGPTGRRVRLGTGWLALSQDDLDHARDDLQAAAGAGELGESQRLSAWGTGWLARAELVGGDADAALGRALVGSRKARTQGLDLVVPLLDWTVVQVLALRGEWEAAEARVRLGRVGGRDYPIMRVPAALARASLADARADAAGVLRALEPLTQPWAHGWVSHPGFWPWAHLEAEALVAVGEFDRALALLDDQARRARDAAHVTEQARLDGARGFLLAQQGDLAAARPLFMSSALVLASRGLVLDSGRVRLLQGRSLRRAGHRGDAHEALLSARLDFEQLGATAYLARCDAELGVIHATRPAPPVAGGPAALLTGQERSVAELVARGLTNKQVAAELFISAKTVQYHLTRIYLKLQVHSRVELAARWTALAGG